MPGQCQNVKRRGHPTQLFAHKNFLMKFNGINRRKDVISFLTMVFQISPAEAGADGQKVGRGKP